MRPISAISERKPAFRKGDDPDRGADRSGTFTLEAALALPLFLLVVLFFILLIRTAVISMALHGALSQSVRLAATVWQPIALALEQGAETAPNAPLPGGTPTDVQGEAAEGVQAVNGSGTEWPDAGGTLRELGDVLPEPFGEWARRAADGNWRPDQPAARAAFKSLVLRFADPDVLDPSLLEILEVRLPSNDRPEETFLAVKASYRLPFRVPLLKRPLEIRESAAERAWIGGKPLPAGKGDGTNDPGHLVFVSLEPDPVRPGKKATLTLQAKPGEAVHLTVYYKSGASQAKNLGTAMADENGRVEWTWHVSGRTTPGEWQWEAVAADGSVLRRSFTVAGKEGGK
jgi:hypothetical protein